MKKYFCILLMILSLGGSAQNINLISETDLPGIIILPGNSFTGQDLNSYNSSGANLYFEYGFKKLFTNEYLLDKDRVSLDVYIMDNAPSAFGIYSIMSSRCTQRDLFGSFSCITQYKVAAVSGILFIYASNKAGTPSGQSLCENLVKMIIDKNPQEVWHPPALVQFAMAAPFTNSLCYYKGPVGLIKKLPAWSDMFENLAFHMYTINISTPDYSGILARIIFPDETTLSSFIMNSSLDVMSTTTAPVRTTTGLYRSWYKIKGTKILFLESNSPLANIKDFIPEMPDDNWLGEKISE